jgi:hypothetical protein
VCLTPSYLSCLLPCTVPVESTCGSNWIIQYQQLQHHQAVFLSCVSCVLSLSLRRVGNSTCRFESSKVRCRYLCGIVSAAAASFCTGMELPCASLYDQWHPQVGKRHSDNNTMKRGFVCKCAQLKRTCQPGTPNVTSPLHFRTPSGASQQDQQLVAWIEMRSSGEIHRIMSCGDAPSLTDHRFVDLCRRSVARMSSMLEGESSSGKDISMKNLSADLEVGVCPFEPRPLIACKFD